MTSELTFVNDNDVGLITLNRPHKRNALTLSMYDQLAEICQDIIDGRVALRAMIITGAGDKAFAAGTDISSFEGLISADDALKYEQMMDRVLGLFESVPVPTVAAIRGACTGGGAAIALCCDLRIADDNLQFGFPIARTLGNCLSTRNLARIVESLGASLTRDILLTARLIRIDEALDVRLVSEFHEEPLKRALELAETFKQHAPLTMAASKEGLRRIRQQWAAVADDDLIVECYTSEDFREGQKAFLEKRTPLWKGR
ncbi:MAG: enoyl-CoA hydratase [bacterium]|jgi:enoyl-CoA hydratase/carnithine racemase